MIEKINQRVSYHAHELTGPAPSREELAQILSTVTSTPDHGNLKPWQLLIIEADSIDHFCDTLLDYWLTQHPEGHDGHARRLLNYVKQAPMIILVSARVRRNHPVCEMDQVLSAAAACQNILLATDGLGYGGIWYSTEVANDVELKKCLGLNACDRPVGLLILGTPISDKRVQRSDVRSLCQFWSKGELKAWDKKNQDM